MVDVTAAVRTAGLSVAQNLIVSWIEHGRIRVEVTEVESSIARQADEEAARIRVRADDLSRATQQMMRELVGRTPQLSYSLGATGPALELQFDPRDPAASKQLLSDLRLRAGEISADLIRQPEPGNPQPGPEKEKDIPKVTIEPGPDPGKQEGKTAKKKRSAVMLDELRERVRNAEDDRR